MKQQLLNGIWQYRVGRGAWGEREVPYSDRPVGHSECRRTFSVPAGTPCVLLRFEGICYHAEVRVNGARVGEMLPYCAYTFDITDLLRPDNNELWVGLEDITPVYGPSEGWENYGGIPRDVMLLLGERQYLSDVFFSATLNEALTDARCTVAVTAQHEAGDRVRVTLLDGGREILCREETMTVDCRVEAEASGVRLWSPDDPYLYTLRTELIHGGHVVDTDVREVGFRSFRVGKRRFYLNGKPIFMYGVCLHEMRGEAGHLTDPAAIERDLRSIKEMGCNYVRLVHYPHSRVTLELADRLGLMVSEEPGLWWSDTSLPENHDGSLEVLRRTILRDRSHASIVFWLCFNECRFTERFLVDSAKTCRAWDPTRPVSGANCMSPEDTIKYYELCGFDFYTMHPYDATTKRICDSVALLRDKPLIFTEWGGYYVYDNPSLLRQFIRQMIAFWHEDDAGDVLAGACYWCYADMYEYNRRRPAVQDGILTEGLVGIHREKSTMFDVFVETWRELSVRPDPAACYEGRLLGALPEGRPLTLPRQEESVWAEVMARATEPIPRYLLNKRVRRLSFGPQTREPLAAGLPCRPYVLTAGQALCLSASGQGERIVLLGAVAVSDAYPLTPFARYGEALATLTVGYADGRTEEIPLRDGVHVTTVFTTFGPSRIRPVAECAVPFAEFSYDKNFENYLINRVDLPIPAGDVTSLTAEAAEGQCLLLWGVWVE